MSIEQVLDLILGNLGVLVMLLFVLLGGYRGWWVFGWYASELRQRIEKLESRLDRAERVAERGTGLAQQATRIVERVAGASGE